MSKLQYVILTHQINCRSGSGGITVLRNQRSDHQAASTLLRVSCFLNIIKTFHIALYFPCIRWMQRELVISRTHQQQGYQNLLRLVLLIRHPQLPLQLLLLTTTVCHLFQFISTQYRINKPQKFDRCQWSPSPTIQCQREETKRNSNWSCYNVWVSQKPNSSVGGRGGSRRRGRKAFWCVLRSPQSNYRSCSHLLLYLQRKRLRNLSRAWKTMLFTTNTLNWYNISSSEPSRKRYWCIWLVRRV